MDMSDSAANNRDWITTSAAWLMLLIAGYVLGYFLLVSRSTLITDGQTWWALPRYHGVSPRLFEPVHILDRNYSRPSKWAGTIPVSLSNGTNTSGFDEFLIEKLSLRGQNQRLHN